jgi:NAD(P)-dependent dehydrogenase (short-subunit alcohol dehydrogenase family)
VVTGGGGPGIGSAISRALAADGFTVWVADADQAAAEQAAEAIGRAGAGGQAVPRQLDVADEDAVEALFAEVAASHGSLHALVNSAGIGLQADVAEVKTADYDRVMGVNLRGAWLCTRAALRLMHQGGAIVNIGSVHATGAERGHAVYAATKTGLVALTRATARDYGVAGVRCNIVHPGAVDSPQTRKLSAERGEDPEAMLGQFTRVRQMLPRPVSADDVGSAVAFLVSDRAAAITGVELPVDGGLTAMLWDNAPVGRQAR